MRKRELKFRYILEKNNELRLFDISIIDCEIQTFNLNRFRQLTTFEGWSIIDVLQYTGLLDKNKKGVYEGDILSNWTTLWLIKWGDKEIDYCGYVAERISDEWHELFLNHNWHNSEIVGNMYENKDLLEKTKKI